MCDLCNGKGVIHEYTNYGIGFYPCPNCPPCTISVYEKYPELCKEVGLLKRDTA